MKKTYFGLNIHKDFFVCEDEIKELPFYKFWLESSVGSNLVVENNKRYIHLSDWKKFSKHFIKNGVNRFQVQKGS